MLLLFSKLSLHLLVLHLVLLNGLRLLVDLLLEGARDLHHLLVVLLDPLTSPVHILLQVLQTHRPLVQPDVQRCDVTVASKSGSQIRLVQSSPS